VSAGAACPTFTIEDDKIAEYDVIADPARLLQLDVAVLN
jgi:hypothetical protein